VELQEYNNGAPCTSVHHYKVAGGEHIMAGTNGNVDVDIMKVIWNFLSKYDIDGLIGCPSASISETDMAHSDIRVYPNPSNDAVYIEISSRKNQPYTLFDSAGKIIETGELKNGKSTIDLSQLASNIYLLNIQNKVIKVVKN
jgi:hypothetical protein